MKKSLTTQKLMKKVAAFSLITVLFVVLLDLVTIRGYEHQLAQHAAASTFTVCHGIPKKTMPVSHEKYYCSNEGCYSDDQFEMSVIGSYQDGNTCAGIAKSLQDAVK